MMNVILIKNDRQNLLLQLLRMNEQGEMVGHLYVEYNMWEIVINLL